MIQKIPKYWKFQLIGWGVFTCVEIILVVLNLACTPDSPGLMYGRVLLVSLLGLGVSHLMKNTITHFNVTALPPGRQVIYLFVLTILFSSIFLALWMVIFIFFKMKNLVDSRLTYFEIFFWLAYGFAVTFFIWNSIYLVHHYIRQLLYNEKRKISEKKELWELEKRALRAQIM